MKEFCIEKTRNNVLKAMSGISKPSEESKVQGQSSGFRGIPHSNYYLIFLMMVDLLEYDYFGPAEKLAYGIPFDFNGLRCCVTYQKFGMRLSCSEGADGEAIYKVIQKGIKAAKPYFLWRADQASTSSNLNLESKCPQLWEKYQYLREQSRQLLDKFETDKDRVVVEEGETDKGWKFTSTSYPAYEFLEQGKWMHESAVDAFFAWCEQALVHIAILKGELTNGKEIVDVLKGDFGQKCKLVFDLKLVDEKAAYDDILSLRNELRNYIAHGSFGKDGAAFSFHTATGAVPLRVLDKKSRSEFAFESAATRDWKSDYQRIETFLDRLWENGRAPAKQFLETGYPSILTYAVDGTYKKAMASEDMMESFLNHLGRMMDNSANMDF
ncbi:MAG: hypothetical protein ACSHX3_07820 [Litorimonas sp.]